MGKTEYGIWMETPRWKRWLLWWLCFNPSRPRDCPMRRWAWESYSVGGEYDGQWEYASYEQVAREFLGRHHERS